MSGNIILVEIKGTFVSQEEVSIYLVNSDNPNQDGVMTKEPCPHCNESHIYKFTKEPFNTNPFFETGWLEYHHCKCPSCQELFVVKIDFIN